jgi:hypothetical protein
LHAVFAHHPLHKGGNGLMGGNNKKNKECQT